MIAQAILDYYRELYDIKHFFFGVYVPLAKANHWAYESSYKIIREKFKVKTRDLPHLQDIFAEQYQKVVDREKHLDSDWVKTWPLEDEDSAFGIISKIQLADGTYRYLCMIDFECPIVEENLQRVRLALMLLKTGPGIIVESGNSYHFYGERLWEQYEDWKKFYKGAMEKNFLYGNWPKLAQMLIGRRWGGFQVQQGFVLLRITDSKRKPVVPAIVDHFAGEMLDAMPAEDAPCRVREKTLYSQGLEIINDPNISQDDWDRLIAEKLGVWPETKYLGTRYCSLPCPYEGITLACPSTRWARDLHPKNIRHYVD